MAEQRLQKLDEMANLLGKEYALEHLTRQLYLTKDRELYARFYPNTDLADPNHIYYQFMTLEDKSLGLFKWVGGIEELDLTDVQKAATEFNLRYTGMQAENSRRIPYESIVSPI